MKNRVNFSFLLLLLSFTLIATHDWKPNQLSGKIKLRDCSDTIKKGIGYNKDGTEIMHSDDPMAKAEMNIIISLHPLDFQPKLTLKSIPTPPIMSSKLTFTI